MGRRIKSAWSLQDKTRSLAIYAWAGRSVLKGAWRTASGFDMQIIRVTCV